MTGYFVKTTNTNVPRPFLFLKISSGLFSDVFYDTENCVNKTVNHNAVNYREDENVPALNELHASISVIIHAAGQHLYV